MDRLADDLRDALKTWGKIGWWDIADFGCCGALLYNSYDGGFTLRIHVVRCSIPDDHIDRRRSALFVARSILREVRDGRRAC